MFVNLSWQRWVLVPSSVNWIGKRDNGQWRSCADDKKQNGQYSPKILIYWFKKETIYTFYTENPLSDSYTFVRTLTRLTMHIYYSRLLVYGIVNVSLWFSYGVSTKCIEYNYTICIGTHRLRLRYCTNALEFVL